MPARENFDPEVGRKAARQNAANKIWALEGYLSEQALREGGAVKHSIAAAIVSSTLPPAGTAFNQHRHLQPHQAGVGSAD